MAGDEMVVTSTDLEIRRWAAEMIGDPEWTAETVVRMDAELLVERLCLKLAEAQGRLAELGEHAAAPKSAGAAETLPNLLGAAETRPGPMVPPVQPATPAVADFKEIVLEALKDTGVVAFVWDLQTGTMQFTEPGERVPWLRRRLTKNTFADFCESVHPEERDNFMADLSEALRTGKPMRVEHRVVAPDGSNAWARIEGHVMVDAKGGGSLFVGILIDAEDFGASCVEDSEVGEEARNLFNDAPVALAVFDREMPAILAVNKAACAMYGYTADEFTRLPLRALYPPEDWAMALKIMATLRSTNSDEPWSAVLRHVRKNGEIFNVELRTSDALFRGRKMRLVSSTEQVHPSCLAGNGSSGQVGEDDALGDFTGNVAHDFNNLLTGILGNADLALAETGDPRLFEYLMQIETGARRATELTRQLLAKSRREPAAARRDDIAFDSDLGYEQLRPDWKSAGTILVVDDEEAIRNLAATMLERVGFTVLTAADGIEATRVFERRFMEIRAVVLDMTMPRMSGDETLSQLRNIDPSVRVLLSSGFSEREASKRFAGRDVAGFIEKPYRADRLLAAIKALLEV